MAVTVRRFAPSDPNLHNASLQALALPCGDDFAVGDVLELKFGSELQTIQFLGRVTAFRPYGSADLHLSPNTVVEYDYATSLPDARARKGFDSAPADLSEADPRVSMANFTTQAGTRPSPGIEPLAAHRQEQFPGCGILRSREQYGFDRHWRSYRCRRIRAARRLFRHVYLCRRHSELAWPAGRAAAQACFRSHRHARLCLRWCARPGQADVELQDAGSGSPRSAAMPWPPSSAARCPPPTLAGSLPIAGSMDRR